MRLGRFDDAVKARRNALRLIGATARSRGRSRRGADRRPRTASSPPRPRQRSSARWRSMPSDFKARYLPRRSRPSRTGSATKRPRSGARCSPTRRRMRRGSRWCARRWRASMARRAAAAPGPSADDVAAASEMTPEQRAEMVRGMVERLAERLKQDGSDVEGWLRLVRAYMVLGDRDKARCRRRRRAPRARPAMPTSCAGSMNWSKGWGWKADEQIHDPQAAAPGPDRLRASACSALAAGLVLFALKDSIVFFNSPTDVVEKQVAPGSAHPARRAGEARHAGARRQSQRALRGDRRQQARSRCAITGILPDLFREGQGVVDRRRARRSRRLQGRHACSPSTTRPTCRRKSPTR